jgi:hypothetical protein
MKRSFLCLSVLSAIGLCATPGQCQSQAQAQAPAPSTAQPQAAPASSNPRKVWTNDDVGSLRSNSTVSVVGKASPVGASKTNTQSQPASYEKDPAWYRKQLAPLQAEVEKLDAQIAKTREFIKGGSASEPQPFYFRPPGDPQDQLNQLEKKRQREAAKIDDLLDRARHNGVEPGALR